MWYDVGNRVTIDQEARDRYGLSAGPWEVVGIDNVNANGVALLWLKSADDTDAFMPWIRLSSCTPYIQTLAEKERAAMNKEPWRRRRDEMLKEVFREERRVPPPERQEVSGSRRAFDWLTRPR